MRQPGPPNMGETDVFLQRVRATVFLGLLLTRVGLPASAQHKGNAAPPAAQQKHNTTKQAQESDRKQKGAPGEKDDKKGDQDNKAGDNKQGKDALDKEEDEASRPPAKTLAIGQATFILQNLFPFHSPYEGDSSLRSRNETELSHIYTLYLGAKITPNLEAFINPELALGHGVSEDTGLGTSANGSLAGQGELREEPYLARFFLRWRIPLRSKYQDTEVRVGTSENLLRGKVPAHRIVVTAGKFAYSDIFDANSYANDERTQFLNDAFINNPAYDGAQDTRGYTQGLTVAWVNPDWALRVGFFQMPTTAGGPDLAGFLHDRGDQIEVELRPRLFAHRRAPAIVRLIAFRNFANMGRYQDALALAQQTGQMPDMTAVRKPGAVKFGYALGLEQGLSDEGKTGVFLRWGWNNGATESFAFAEVDRAFSIGGQLSGKRWRREDDKLGFAFAQNDLSAVHRDYLAAGGTGLQVGDGQLNYGAERIVEAYYSYQISKPLAISLDYQHITNPGYNRDRGPVSLLSLRLHYEF